MKQGKISHQDKDVSVLVMGGLGFIGSHVSRLLVDRGFYVRILDKKGVSRKLLSDLEGRIEIQGGDAETPDDVLGALRNIDVVVDLIHTTVPGSSMNNPSYDVYSNVASHAAWP